MSRTLQLSTRDKPIPLFSPTIFETNVSDTPNGANAVREFERERMKKLNTDDLYNLKSPGSFKFSIDDSQVADGIKFLTRSMETTLLSYLFYSKANVKNIQDVLRLKVYQKTGQVISDQNPNELIVIMNSIYVQYSQHPDIITEEMPIEIKQQLLAMYTNEVKRLNELVIEYCFPAILNGLQQYVSYLRDASSLPYQMHYPTMADNVKGQRVYRSTTQVLGNMY